MDGHCSHYTVDLLQHARNNGIHILCYPSHSTHVYQGSVVAIFSPLKRFYQDELRTFERGGGGRVTKETFMKLYSSAHIKAFIDENIRIAWRKTGVIPLNPNAIRASAFKTSLEATNQPGTLPLSFVQSTPARIVVRLLTAASHPVPSDVPASDDSSTKLLTELHKSRVGFLVSSEELTPTAKSRLPSPMFEPLSPGPIQYLSTIRNMVPTTENEDLLRNVVGVMADKIAGQGRQINTMQATMILHETYVNKLQAQLNYRDRKRKSRARLLGDGLPVLLSGDEFYERAKQHQQRKDAEAKRRVLALEARKVHFEEMKQWKRTERERKERNKVAGIAYKARLKDWESRKASAKVSKVRFTEARPLRGRLEKAIPKPMSLKVEEGVGDNMEQHDYEYFDLEVVESDEEEDDEEDG